MSNFNKAYNKITELPPKEETTSNNIEVQDASKVQARMVWLSSDFTKEMFNKIAISIESLENDARKIAIGNHTEFSNEKIKLLLIQAETLRNIINTYAH